MAKTDSKGPGISTRSFLTAIIVIFCLMVASFILGNTIPGGSYARIRNAAGEFILYTAAGFRTVSGGISFKEWILSPILVLNAPGSGSLIAVIAFLLVIGGIFSSLDHCGLMKYMLQRTVHRFAGVRWRLMAVTSLLFMAMGAMIGSFEEVVPLVPIVTALAVSLGWDPLTGIGMSLLAAGCGFASGVCNPFTVGVAQQLAELPMFSGAWLRVLSFVLIWILLFTFLRRHARKVERPSDTSAASDFVPDKKMDRALGCFGGVLGGGIVLVFCSAFLPFLRDFTMIIVAVTFLAAGLIAAPMSGMSAGKLAKTFFQGVVTILPAVVMILMASSIKYTLEEARVLDTILHKAVQLAGTLPDWSVILFIYLVVMVMNFFIPSGSAKAFMLIPLIVPLAQIFGISPQLCIVAFAFGDGFSNAFYPTNPVLLISLGLVDVSYGDWFRWSGKFQLMNILLTSGILLFGLAVGY